MNDYQLTTQVFPALVEKLRQQGEVWVPIDYISQFATHLKLHHTTLWQQTDQDPGVSEQLESRFYIR